MSSRQRRKLAQLELKKHKESIRDKLHAQLKEHAMSNPEHQVSPWGKNAYPFYVFSKCFQPSLRFSCVDISNPWCHALSPSLQALLVKTANVGVKMNLRARMADAVGFYICDLTQAFLREGFLNGK